MLEVTGVPEVTAALAALPSDADQAVGEALITHGRAVITAAGTLTPVRTGKLKAAMTTTYTPTEGLLVDAGTATAPYAYTMHAQALGVSGGYMVFDVPAHSRRGSYVNPYRTARRIPNRPYLTTTWDRLLPQLWETVTASLARVVT